MTEKLTGWKLTFAEHKLFPHTKVFSQNEEFPFTEQSAHKCEAFVPFMLLLLTLSFSCGHARFKKNLKFHKFLPLF